MNKLLLSGNEAIARGAWEAGCDAGFGYPGTPSTETLEAFSKLPDVYAEWAVNEKVALENALGFSMAGHRALVTMKHVGVNVAADPLMSLAYAGVSGGLVMLAADDPGMFSSQNEQDSRFYAQFARVPMFEPADSSEARAMAIEAFRLSEEFGTIVMIRSTVRISHTRTPVVVGERTTADPISYKTSIPDWVMMPAYARPKRLASDERQDALRAYAESSSFNRIELRDTRRGFICSGAVYQHVREALPDASVLKLGLSYPLPAGLIGSFFEQVDDVYVVEEASTYYDQSIRALGFVPAAWPHGLPAAFELSPALIKIAMGEEAPLGKTALESLPARPPALCAGCPHRVPFVELKRMKAIVLGDIGCYTLGALAPLQVLESAIDMGASISMGHGFEVARTVERARGTQNVSGGTRPIFSVIGDSTFAHSGLSGVISSAYNNGTGNIVILDNRTTAMTGGQGNPVSGINLQDRPCTELDLEAVLKAVGVSDVVTVDALDVSAVRTALRNAAARSDTLSVVICKSPCVVEYKVHGTARRVNEDACRMCGACLRIGCPALSRTDEGRAHIDGTLCNGCSQCEQYCPFDAIFKEE